jgi:hypothetical protein
MKADEIELIGALAEALALEYADVDDEYLDTINESIEVLTRARRGIECHGLRCPEAVELIIERYHRHVQS